MTVLNLQVSALNDDCAGYASTFFSGTVRVYAGVHNANLLGSGMRFQSVAIPVGSTIVSAYLKVTAYAGGFDITKVVVNSRIRGQDDDSPSDFSADTWTTFLARTRTTAKVEWDAIPAWTVDTEYTSPDIGAVIQEIIYRAGWASGNSLVVFWDDYDQRSVPSVDYARRDGSSYNTSNAKAAKLVITYTAPTILPTITIQSVTNIVTTTATGNGNITSLGDAPVTQHGHCWNTTGTPTTADSKTENGAKSTTGAFTSSITSLTAGTKYYVRAYATNGAGTGYSNEVQFWANQGTVIPDTETQPLRRVSGIKRTFWAGIGGQSVYQVELALGGMSTTYVSPIKERQPKGAITPIPLPTGEGYQYSDYQAWLNSFASYLPIIRLFGHMPSYEEWTQWIKKGQAPYFPKYF